MAQINAKYVELFTASFIRKREPGVGITKHFIQLSLNQ